MPNRGGVAGFCQIGRLLIVPAIEAGTIMGNTPQTERPLTRGAPGALLGPLALALAGCLWIVPPAADTLPRLGPQRPKGRKGGEKQVWQGKVPSHALGGLGLPARRPRQSSNEKPPGLPALASRGRK